MHILIPGDLHGFTDALACTLLCVALCVGCSVWIAGRGSSVQSLPSERKALSSNPALPKKNRKSFHLWNKVSLCDMHGETPTSPSPAQGERQVGWGATLLGFCILGRSL
jgi:hypothetical protein